MSRVLAELCQLAFAKYDLLKIFARVLAENEPSRRVLDKAGFQHEGTLHSQTFRDGTPYDVHYYGLVRET